MRMPQSLPKVPPLNIYKTSSIASNLLIPYDLSAIDGEAKPPEKKNSVRRAVGFYREEEVKDERLPRAGGGADG